MKNKLFFRVFTIDMRQLTDQARDKYDFRHRVTGKKKKSDLKITNCIYHVYLLPFILCKEKHVEENNSKDNHASFRKKEKIKIETNIIG